ncbi:hypothetical protein [Streptomyces sp. NBC_01089]|uniref:hypothetical protein n=1 Tax=Streptomyces sp. NBC_01089 TaxID=2903747 RepID=UPI003866D97E|nr:STAS domain-containing protein [Streptomyces sp. NBC_01089]
MTRPDGALFFGNVSRTRLGIKALLKQTDPPPHAVVLDIGTSFHLGVPVLDVLDELHEELTRSDIPSTWPGYAPGPERT